MFGAVSGVKKKARNQEPISGSNQKKIRIYETPYKIRTSPPNIRKPLWKALHHAPSELQRTTQNGFKTGPHSPSTSTSINVVHDAKRPAVHMRTYSPIIYIFLSYPQQSLSNSPCVRAFSRQVDTCDVQEAVSEMGDVKRLVASNHRPAKRLPKTSAARCLSLERCRTQNVLRTPF